MTVIDNQFPYKVYEVANAGSSNAHVFLGKASIAGINGSNSDFYANLAESNCYTTFLFASIVGGKNVTVTPATNDDPYIYIDSRWYDFLPCGNSDTSILSKVEQVDSTGDINVYIKSLTSDGTILIDSGDCALTLRAHIYTCKNENEDNGVFSRTLGTPGQDDATFFFKSIVGGTCINVVDTGTELIINYDESCNQCDEFT